MPRKKKAKEEEVYHVEVITKARVGEGEWEYLVKWAGYDSDADSWEPASNVQQCDRLLASFWKHVGTDDYDYSPGYEVAAEESWIDKEKRYYAETFGKPPKPKSDKATKKERRKSESKSSISEGTVADSTSSDEEPVPTPAKKFTKKPRVVGSESDSESDGHLRQQTIKAPRPPARELAKVPSQAKRQGMPSASSSSLPIAPPRAPVVRTHQDQRTNPLVKAMDLPSKSVEAGSSLSTKQRIAAGILPPPTGPKPLPPGPKKSLSSLSFKKNKPPIPSSSQIKDATAPSPSVPAPVSPVAQSTNIINDVEVMASPQPMDIDEPADLFGSMLDDPAPLDRSPEILTAAIPPKSREEINAEAFLNTVDIPAFNQPLEVDVTTDQPGQQMIELPKTPVIPKIPKKWRWSGDLFISTSESKTELLCAVAITDPGGISNSSHINLLLSSLDSLRMSKLYPIMDLSPLLRACGKPQYFGKLESNEPSDEVAIEGLGHHLTNEGLAAAIPLLLDGAEVAVLVVFPRAQQGLIKVLQVPEHLLSGSPLLVVLLPYLVSTMTSTKAIGYRSIDAVQQSLLNLQDLPHDFPQDIILHQAMSLLCFPKALLDFFNSSTSRPYCIWPMQDQLSPGLDTTMLQCILKSTKAVSTKLDEDVRVIFISNRHLEVLHTMPSLVTKRANSPEIQFWRYGYSADMTCEKWKVQEIYPLGGIVTFTPSALVEDLLGCHLLIAQIIEHPLWDCYLIPEVLAASHLLCNNGDPSSSEPCLGPILNFINVGSMAVTRMPEKGHSKQATWLSQVFNPSSTSGHELLEVCLEALRSQHTNLSMTAEELKTFVKNEITKDLSNAQIQPALMENYRRFVVIRAASEDAIPFDKDGIEWSSLSQFNFKDDYFQL